MDNGKSSCIFALIFLVFLMGSAAFLGKAGATGVMPAPNPPPSRVKGFSATLFKHKIFYVSVSGKDDNNGTIKSPFRTLKRALYEVSPGDIILIRNGIYDIDVGVNVSGSPGHPVIIEAYPGEQVVFDGSSYDLSVSVKFRITGSWLVIRNLEVRNGPSDGVLLTEGAGFNVLENLKVHDNYFAGIELENGAHHNIIRNCDSYRNFDYGPSKGEHADGFGAKFSVGPGNVFTGCRAWNNSDDGFDLWDAGKPVTIEYCWAWENGFDIWGVGDVFQGDGNGFKLGPGSPVIHHCLSWHNARRGFDYNDATEAIRAYNNTSYNNQLHGFKFALGPHVLRNNLSFMDEENYIGPKVDDAYNSWNTPPGITVSTKDFLSLDDTKARGPREKGGGLPRTDFLRLSPASSLIDAGIDVGLPFYGKGPDIGARESLYQRVP